MIVSGMIGWLTYFLGREKSQLIKLTKQNLCSKLIGEQRQHKKPIKQAKEAFLSSELPDSTLAKIAPVGIFYTSDTGYCLYVNERWCEIAGISAQEALGEGWSVAIHPEDRSRVFAEWSDSITLNLPFKAEYRFKHPDGRTIWVMGQAMAQRDDRGKVKGYVGTLTDITSVISLRHSLPHHPNCPTIRVLKPILRFERQV